VDEHQIGARYLAHEKQKLSGAEDLQQVADATMERYSNTVTAPLFQIGMIARVNVEARQYLARFGWKLNGVNRLC
jgi:hypothetical protein